MPLSEELETFQRVMCDRATSLIGPHASALDRDQAFLPEVWAAVRDLEMFALPFPVDVGGLGGSFLDFVVATEAIARTSASAALYPGTTVQVAGTVLAHGTPEQI